MQVVRQLLLENVAHIKSHDSSINGSICFKDTHRENTLSNKTQAVTEIVNMYIWVIGRLNQLFNRFLNSYSYKFSKN